MEYSIDQSVVWEQGNSTLIGKIAGQSGENFIVTLDMRLKDGTRAMLVPASIVRPLSCRWCVDTKKVAVSPVTGGQIESGDIPQVACPYCG